LQLLDTTRDLVAEDVALLLAAKSVGVICAKQLGGEDRLPLGRAGERVQDALGG